MSADGSSEGGHTSDYDNISAEDLRNIVKSERGQFNQKLKEKEQ